MKCPWIKTTKIFKFRDVSLPTCYGVRKEVTFGGCVKDYCPFYFMGKCKRVDLEFVKNKEE